MFLLMGIEMEIGGLERRCGACDGCGVDGVLWCVWVLTVRERRRKKRKKRKRKRQRDKEKERRRK